MLEKKKVPHTRWKYLVYMVRVMLKQVKLITMPWAFIALIFCVAMYLSNVIGLFMLLLLLIGIVSERNSLSEIWWPTYTFTAFVFSLQYLFNSFRILNDTDIQNILVWIGFKFEDDEQIHNYMIFILIITFCKLFSDQKHYNFYIKESVNVKYYTKTRFKEIHENTELIEDYR